MDKQKKNNFKKLLCYNIVNNIKCVYKHKCMFAHNINEQLKDSYREFIYNMIYVMNDLSNVNIKENKELFEELIIFTKECRNCINKKCPGGYNCKFGVCLKNLKICYNDLLNGKCLSPLEEEIIDDKVIKRCSSGIHLTEKNLIPYYQRVSCEINIIDYGVFLFNNINYYSKINTLSVMLNDETIKFVKNLINKSKINKNDILANSLCEDKYNFNFVINDNKNIFIGNKNKNDDTIFEDNDIMEEYKNEKSKDDANELNNYFWRYHQFDYLKNNKINLENEYYDDNNEPKIVNDEVQNNINDNENEKKEQNNSFNNELDTNNQNFDLKEKIKNIIRSIDETNNYDF